MKNKKIEAKQYLRYVKTFAWAIKKNQTEISEAVLKKRIDDYPVDARDLRDAITCIETGEGLRPTGTSITDLYAIKEALKHIQNESNTVIPGDTEPEVEHGSGTSEADSPVLDSPSKKRATRSRKSSKDKPE